MKNEFSTCPHAPGQINGGQKITDLWVAIVAKFGLARCWQEIQPMGAGPQRIILLWSRIVSIKCRIVANEGGRRNRVERFFRPAQPILKCFRT